MMVTNLDASLFPTVKIGSGKQRQSLFFDRILCDVPCSGDGTLRKNMQIWNSWQPAVGNGLHSLVYPLRSLPSACLFALGRFLLVCNCEFSFAPCRCSLQMADWSIQHAHSILLRMRLFSLRRSIQCQVSAITPMYEVGFCISFLLTILPRSISTSRRIVPPPWSQTPSRNKQMAGGSRQRRHCILRFPGKFPGFIVDGAGKKSTERESSADLIPTRECTRFIFGAKVK